MWYCYSVYKCICMLVHEEGGSNERVRVRERMCLGKKVGKKEEEEEEKRRK